MKTTVSKWILATAAAALLAGAGAAAARDPQFRGYDQDGPRHHRPQRESYQFRHGQPALPPANPWGFAPAQVCYWSAPPPPPVVYCPPPPPPPPVVYCPPPPPPVFCYPVRPGFHIVLNF